MATCYSNVTSILCVDRCTNCACIDYERMQNGFTALVYVLPSQPKDSTILINCSPYDISLLVLEGIEADINVRTSL